MLKKRLVRWTIVITLTLLVTGLFLFLNKKSSSSFERDLTVISATPQGGVQDQSESDMIQVSFGSPMVPLGSPKGKFPFRISPKVPGSLRWVGTSTLLFEPSPRLPLGSRFKVTIPKGTRSLDGKILAHEYVWTFETLRPRVALHAPSDEEKWEDPTNPLVVVFNQLVDPQSISSYISLHATGGKVVPVTVEFPKRSVWKKIDFPPVSRAVAIIPEEPLKKGTAYTLHLLAGLPGREGKLGMEEDVHIAFSTWGPLAFVGESKKKIDPDQTVSLEFNNPVSCDEVLEHLHITPALKELSTEDLCPSSEFTTTLNLRLPLNAEKNYTMTLDQGIPDQFGQRLARSTRFTVEVGPYPPYVSMTTGYGVLESDQKLLYPLWIRNASAVGLGMSLIKPNDIIPLIGKLHWVQDEEYSEERKPNEFEDRFWKVSRILNFKRSSDKKPVPIHVDEVFNSIDHHGIVLLQVDAAPSYQADPSKMPPNRYLRALVQCTELGITGKFSAYSNLIWVTRLHNTTPVADAKVEIRDANNKVWWTGQTGSDGSVKTPGWKRLGMSLSKNPWQSPVQYVLVKSGNDVALSSSEWGSGIYPYEFGISYDWYPVPEEAAGYLLTDREIYRQGESVKLKGIVREKAEGNWEIPKGKKIYINILDPRGDVFFEKKEMPVSDWGSFDLSISVPKNAVSGSYQVTASFKPIPTLQEHRDWSEGRLNLFRTSFEVAAYRPVSFKVSVKVDQKNYFPGEQIKAMTEARYLFGAPMSGEEVQWSWSKSRTYFTPPGNDGFIFGNWISDEERSYYGSTSLENGQGVFDSKGTAQIEKTLPKNIDTLPYLYELGVTAKGLDRQEVTDTIDVLVHPALFYVGLRPSDTFVREGKPLKINVMAATPDGKAVQGKIFKLSVIHEKWLSVRKVGFGGRYEWMSEKEDETVSTGEVTTQGTPVSYEFRPEASGFYFVRAVGNDEDGNIVRTATSFYATGHAFRPWKAQEDDRIELVADKSKYQAGEQARILVKSPYPECRALVTVEREGVISSWIAELKGSSPEIDVPISENFIPNVFVGVILIHSRADVAKYSGADLGKPSFKMGYVNLPVDSAPNHLHVAVETNQTVYRPGALVTVHLQVKDVAGNGRASEVTVATVDEGVLALLGTKTPDPFETFYGSRPLSVQTSETRLHVVGQRHYGEKGENVGGGGGFMNGKGMRGHFETTPFWSASIHTDAHGIATAHFKLPDNLTTFRIMAVAHSLDSRFGSGEKTFQVNKPLLLLSDLPRFLRPGDEFEGGVVVHNNSKQAGDVVVSSTSKGVVQTGKTIQSFHAEPGESRELRFRFKVAHPGTADFAFRAKMGSEQDGLLVSIPIMNALEFEADALTGDLQEKDPKSEWLRVPESIVPNVGGVELSLSASKLLELKGSARYLLEYPYGCFEQRISRIFPIVLASDLIDSFKLDVFNGESARKIAQRELDDLSRFQTADGGFTLWSGGSISYPYLTAYGVVVLDEAQKRGYHVDEQMFAKAKKYLEKLSKGLEKESRYPYEAWEWDTIDSFIAYALSRQGVVDSGLMERLYGKRHDLSYFSLSSLYKAMAKAHFDLQKQQEIKRMLENGLKIDAVSAHVEEPREDVWFLGSSDRTTAAVLQAFLEVDGDHPAASKMIRYLLGKKHNGYWHNTHDNAFILWALSDYFTKYESESPRMTARIDFPNQEFEANFRDRLAEYHYQVPMKKLPKNTTFPVTFQKTGSGRLYYEMRLRYARAGDIKEISQGISVAKRLETLKGHKIDFRDVRAGEILRVVLKVASKEDRRNVALVDMLPAGFEPLETSFSTEKKNLSLYSGSEENTDWWWSGFNHAERYDDHLFFSSDFLARGTHIITYLVRATGIGTFYLPSTHIEEMYAPEVFGRSDASQIVVKERL